MYVCMYTYIYISYILRCPTLFYALFTQTQQHTPSPCIMYPEMPHPILPSVQKPPKERPLYVIRYNILLIDTNHNNHNNNNSILSYTML